MVVRADELRCEDGACEAAHLVGRWQDLLVRLAMLPSVSTTLAAEWGSTFDTEKIGTWPTDRGPAAGSRCAGQGWPGRTAAVESLAACQGWGERCFRFNFDGPTPYVREPVYP